MIIKRIKLNLYLVIALCTLCNSCKENKVTQGKMLDEKIEKQNSKKYLIPSNLKIEKQEEINIDNDEAKEIIITAVDEKADYFYEFWFKNDKLLYEFKYYWGDVNKKWLVNLDNDETKEIVRIYGYADADEIECVVFDIINKQQKPILYFNPVLEDSRYPNQYMWAYPNDIEGIVTNANNDIQVSLNNDYVRDDEHFEPKNQKELPFVFFKGKTSQPNMKLSKLNNFGFMPLNTVINNVRKSIDLDAEINKQWIGNYEGSFLRLKEESADPRAWGQIKLEINNTNAKLNIDSYVENVEINMKLISNSKNEIKFKELSSNKEIVLTRKLDKILLEGNLIESIVGVKEKYEIKKLKK